MQQTLTHDTATATMTDTVTVAVHAADPISRAGAAQQLRDHPGISLVAGGSTESATVGVVVADTVDETVLTMLRGLSRQTSGRVVLVVGQIGENRLLDVVGCGVGTILWRHQASSSQLANGVLAAAKGRGEVPADLLGRLLGEVAAMSRDGAPGGGAARTALGDREVDVLRLIADGLETAEIASRLFFSERTVKNVLHGLTSRLHLRNRAHAVAYALRAGYL
ncbi:DNA-binding NarL/FixJ family response regulator [Kitasatospora sp. MAA4]|uniref:response regulator transcription factor n=1 Tax=Kitasatospora sp. MAA4 TaxID=3035093 RepID=UPI002473BDFF|nr:response regulator transcription factor [Kitasatospora sp. MAA4]MDH6135169.1 DNA-binding NarL/FixJ family response regulator [Kitasatospora sp. MAA4]